MVRRFTGFVPTSDFGARVVAPPKGLLRPEFASAGVDDDLSFRHRVGRTAGPSQDVARRWLSDAVGHGALRPVDDTVVVHMAERDGRRALGLLADVSVAAYDRGAIKAHEKTIKNTEQKMVGYMLLGRLFGNPVVVAHRSGVALRHLLAEHSSGPADADFEARDGTRHRLWIVPADAADSLVGHYTGDLYIADGHHRLEAARLLAAAEGRPDAWFPAGLYADDEFEVWSFSRGVVDMPLPANELIDRLAADFELAPIDAAVPRPTTRRQFGVRIAGRSFLLTIPDRHITGDAVDRLDVSLLQRLVLGPLVGIEDPRRDKRLQLVADSGDDAHDPDRYDAWFLPHPAAPGDVMEVADLGRTMPPKSTFFLPKIPGGILIRPLDEDGTEVG